MPGMRRDAEEMALLSRLVIPVVNTVPAGKVSLTRRFGFRVQVGELRPG